MTQAPAGKLKVESKRLDPMWKRREKLERDCRRRRKRAGKCHDSRICISVQAAWFVPLPSYISSFLACFQPV